jgi:hypothetical protein
MRDLPTLSSVYHRTKPGSREQAVTELARMEHEKARLEHERAIWIKHAQHTETRLRHVVERIAIVRAAIEPPAPPASPAAGAAGASALEPEAPQVLPDSPAWREVSLEY